MYLKIWVIESVHNIPPQHEELASLDEERVEEAEGEEKLLVLVVTLAAREGGLVHHLVQSLHVGLETLIESSGEINAYVHTI